MLWGDIIYVRKCLGLEGEPIDVYKFRTMAKNADRRRDEIDVNTLDAYGKPVGDTRTTSLGSVIRKIWIDELPQFVNLQKGDLKLVGIRPLCEHNWTYYPEDIKERALKQKPGLLGVQYAHPNVGGFSAHIDNLRLYLDRYAQDPLFTDEMYKKKILHNMFLGQVRSS